MVVFNTLQNFCLLGAFWVFAITYHETATETRTILADGLAALKDEFASYRPVLANRFLELQQADERCVSIRRRLD